MTRDGGEHAQRLSLPPVARRFSVVPAEGHQWSTAGAVVGMAAVASYERAYALVRAHGEDGWTARLVPFTVDGLI